MQTAAFGRLDTGCVGARARRGHVLEMPVKMTYTPELYAAVTSTLYAWFGSVGAVLSGECIVERGMAR